MILKSLSQYIKHIIHKLRRIVKNRTVDRSSDIDRKENVNIFVRDVFKLTCCADSSACVSVHQMIVVKVTVNSKTITIRILTGIIAHES